MSMLSGRLEEMKQLPGTRFLCRSFAILFRFAMSSVVKNLLDKMKKCKLA